MSTKILNDVLNACYQYPKTLTQGKQLQNTIISEGLSSDKNQANRFIASSK